MKENPQKLLKPNLWLCYKKITKEDFVFFQEEFVRLVLPATLWREKHASELLRRYVEISDEAFVVWMYANCYDRWIDMFDKKNTKTSAVPTKWTTNGSVKKDGRSKKYGGVTDEGLLQFNAIAETVSTMRKSKIFRQWENHLLSVYKERESSNKPSNKAQNNTTEKRNFNVYTDFSKKRAEELTTEPDSSENEDSEMAAI